MVGTQSTLSWVVGSLVNRFKQAAIVSNTLKRSCLTRPRGYPSRALIREGSIKNERI